MHSIRGNYWLDNNSLMPKNNAGCIPDLCDVVIIGAGYTGLSAARVLAENGAKVVVLEESDIGRGASARNGGFVSAGLGQKFSVIEKLHGYDMACQFWLSAERALTYLKRTIGELKINCNLRRDGRVKLACKEIHYDYLKNEASYLQKKFGYKVDLLDKKSIRSEVGSGKFFGGILDENSYSIDPLAYLFGLYEAANDAGALIFPNKKVSKVNKFKNDNFEIEHADGIIKSKNVIVATNGYTNKEFGKLGHMILPIYGHIITTEVLPHDMTSIINPHGRLFVTTNNLLNYFRLTPDNRMLFGGRFNFNNKTLSCGNAKRLQKDMIHFFPCLATVKVTHYWAGKMGFTKDKLPYVGEENGLFYAIGYSGHGIAIASALGADVASYLTGIAIESPFHKIKHRHFKILNRKKWLISAHYLYNKVKDFLL